MDGAKRVLAILLILLAVTLIVWFSVANSSRASVYFFLGKAEVAVCLLILGSYVLGFLTCLILVGVRCLVKKNKKVDKVKSRIIGEI